MEAVCRRIDALSDCGEVAACACTATEAPSRALLAAELEGCKHGSNKMVLFFACTTTNVVPSLAPLQPPGGRLAMPRASHEPRIGAARTSRA